MKQSPQKITNPERVERLLKRACSGAIHVLLHSPDDPNAVTRGVAKALLSVDGTTVFLISQISEEGVLNIAAGQTLRGECVLTSSRLEFDVRVMYRGFGALQVALPIALETVERRAAMRVATQPSQTAYVKFVEFLADGTDSSTLPLLPYLSDFASTFLINDISEGGISLYTVFPGLTRYLVSGSTVPVEIILPLAKPNLIFLNVRWSTAKREIIPIEGKPNQIRWGLRAGGMFVDPSPEFVAAIRMFMTQLLEVKAI